MVSLIVVVIFMDGISRWSEIVIESMQTINNALRQPNIIPSPISSYWYADVNWMSLTELGNCLVTQNSIKTYHEYSFKNPICCLYRQILPKFWDNMFRVQNIYGFWWFHSKHDWYVSPWYPADYLEEKWWASNGYVKHNVRAIFHIVKEDRLRK